MKIVERGKIDTPNTQIEHLFRSLIMKICNFMLPKYVTVSYLKEKVVYMFQICIYSYTFF
jgi:hypothetical protein